MKTALIPTRKAMLEFGRSLGRVLAPGDLIALIGDLGAGKTTLTQGIAQGLEVIETVNSPTFALIQQYEGVLPLIHCDPYRLEYPEEANWIGFEEYLYQDGVVVVEWADRIEEMLPEERLILRLEAQGGTPSPPAPLSHAAGEGEESLLAVPADVARGENLTPRPPLRNGEGERSALSAPADIAGEGEPSDSALLAGEDRPRLVRIEARGARYRRLVDDWINAPEMRRLEIEDAE